MAKIKVDPRIKQVIDGSVHRNHRAMFVVIGDNAKNQIPILHHILVKATGDPVDRLPILWVRKKDIGNSDRKQLKTLQKKINGGHLNFNEDNPFDLFLASNVIQFYHYNETQQVLGQTFRMCVLQDFEAVTPNVLARTIETVSGGGLIIILVNSIKSIRDIYNMEMDVHSHYRTESHRIIKGTFNERFILSIGDCPNCLVTDDQLNILSLLPSLSLPSSSTKSEEHNKGEEKFKHKLNTKEVSLSPLFGLCITSDQMNAMDKFIKALANKLSPSTVVTTAARGRGKSAVLGLGLAAAVALGYSRIVVTAPSPENVSTLFEFLCRGLGSLDYKVNQHYELSHLDLPNLNKAVVKVNLFRDHHQTVQYIEPGNCHMLGNPDLVCIDEAAAIPLPLVKKLLGPYMVFMSSTINGYEGTGRSLSLKLINDMRQKSVSSTPSRYGAGQGSEHPKRDRQKDTCKSTPHCSQTHQVLHEIALYSAIRYGDGDPVEKWLYDLLCLDVSDFCGIASACPPPSECQLYYVSCDALFSYHKKAEEFLKRLVAIYVSSHYKNTPNDLQMLADAPAHHVFCLLGPNVKDNQLPEILCVLQVAFEGQISMDSVHRNLQRGDRASGDMIPWTVEQQFDGYDFARKSGLRIVRIATHPSFQGMGYGSRTLELLQEYYAGKLACMAMVDCSLKDKSDANCSEISSLLHEKIKPKENLPPLLVSLTHRPPEKLDYIGVSYGLTPELLKFWKRFGMIPVYVRQTPNDLTGEHSCIMLKPVVGSMLSRETELDNQWLKNIWIDFRKRFLRLLTHDFRTWRTSMVLDVIHHQSIKLPIQACDLQYEITKSDLQRLEKYCDNLVDYRLIKDLIQPLASLYFCRHLDVQLNAIKSAILLGIGLQDKSVDTLAAEFDSNNRNFPAAQILALLHQTIRNLVQAIHTASQKHLENCKNEDMLKEKDGKCSEKDHQTAEHPEWKRSHKTLKQLRKQI